MSNLEELIEQYCPDGVEYVRFVDYANVLYGCPFNAAQFTNDSSYIPLIRIRDVLSGKAGTYYKGEYSHDYIIKKGDILVGMDGNFNLGIWDDIDGLLCQRVCKLYTKDETRLLNGFIRHYMKPVFRQIEESTPGGSVKHLSAKAINSIHIPLPPLPVQEEIVRVLDTFTELQAELQAELQKRKQQYNYYLDNLLNFKNINRGGYQAEVKWMKLKDVATQWYRGAGIKREEVSEDGMPCVRYGEIHTTYNIWFDDCISHTNESKQVSRKYAEKGDILFAITSEDIQLVGNSVAYLGNERIMVGGDIVVMKHNQDPKYMAYALSTSDAIKQKGKGKVKSKVVHTNVPSLQEIVIPIPSMAEQKRIASILDRFDRLTNDLTSGLPAEIEKRRQQYEYYRDKLLTFKRKGA